MERTPVSDAVIERVALIWSRAIAAPKFDNGANSAPSLLAGVLAEDLAASALAAPDYGVKVEAFRLALIAEMKSERDHEGEPHPAPRYDGHVRSLRRGMGVDYDPDRLLCAAAEVADIPRTVFPWKSRIDFWDGQSLSVAFGYAAEPINHYPMSAGRWLMTTANLTGRDRETIIAAVEAGALDALDVEWPGGITRDTFATLEEWSDWQAAEREALAEEAGDPIR